MDQRLERIEQMQIQMQEQLTKFQQNIKDQMLEFQSNVINQLTQLLARGLEREESPAVHFEEDKEEPYYPSNFIPITVQPDMHPQRAPLTIKSQQYQTNTLTPMNRPTGSRSNLKNNLVNPIALDNPAKIKKVRVEYSDTIKAPRKKRE